MEFSDFTGVFGSHSQSDSSDFQSLSGSKRPREQATSRSKYKCSLCGQPKKGHVCTAPRSAWDGGSWKPQTDALFDESMVKRRTLIQKLQERLGKQAEDVPSSMLQAQSYGHNNQSAQQFHHSMFQAPSFNSSHFQQPHDFRMQFSPSSGDESHGDLVSSASALSLDVYSSMPQAPPAQQLPPNFPEPNMQVVPSMAHHTSVPATLGPTTPSRWPCAPLAISDSSPPCIAYAGAKTSAAEPAPWSAWEPRSASATTAVAASISPAAATRRWAVRSPGVLGIDSGLTPGSRGLGCGLALDWLRPSHTPGAVGTPGLRLSVTPRCASGAGWSSPAGPPPAWLVDGLGGGLKPGHGGFGGVGEL